ncbi:hypothetical protein, partial [Burkholderia sp. ABCPW 14]|uniref:hypothetical protein n=1 Tax=Burkholderia sp. ABCPW 14 TaxID=1637860 RepID=UPI001E5A4800
RMLATLLSYQTDCALPDFRGKLAWLLAHGSILSRVRASTKSGAVQITRPKRDGRSGSAVVLRM